MINKNFLMNECKDKKILKPQTQFIHKLYWYFRTPKTNIFIEIQQHQSKPFSTRWAEILHSNKSEIFHRMFISLASTRTQIN